MAGPTMGRVAVAGGQVVAVSLLVLLLSTELPGDTAEVVLGQQAGPDQVAVLRAQLGLDRPVLTRFADWVGGALSGDLGRSLVTGAPVTAELGGRLAGTLTLAGLALAVIVPLALAAGVVAGRRPGSALDRTLSVVGTAGQAVPEFALGLVLVAVFAVGLGWLPATAASGTVGGAAVLVLPVVVLATNQVGRLARQIRIGVVEVDHAEHVEHLRHLGLPERVVLWRHVVPGAVLPAVQQLARVIDGLAGGVVVVETLFALPGVGSGFVRAVGAHDLPLVQAYALLFAVTTVTVNLAADLVSARLAPHRAAAW